MGWNHFCVSLIIIKSYPYFPHDTFAITRIHSPGGNCPLWLSKAAFTRSIISPKHFQSLMPFAFATLFFLDFVYHNITTCNTMLSSLQTFSYLLIEPFLFLWKNTAVSDFGWCILSMSVLFHISVPPKQPSQLITTTFFNRTIHYLREDLITTSQSSYLPPQLYVLVDLICDLLSWETWGSYQFTNRKSHISKPQPSTKLSSYSELTVTAIPMDSVSPWRPLKRSLCDTWPPHAAVRGEVSQIWDKTMISREEWGNDPIETTN